MSFLLDVVEVPCSHTGEALADAFYNVLQEFSLVEKVSRGHLRVQSVLTSVSKKILAVTADNATSNDVMIRALARKITTFPGEANRARCFDHILNLCAKLILRPFDSAAGQDETATGASEDALAELLAGLDPNGKDVELDFDEDLGDNEDEDEEFIDELAELSDYARTQTVEDLRPVKMVLAKVSASYFETHQLFNASQIRKLAFSVINSSTILLPEWYRVLRELGLPERTIPRDVRTRWNSTFLMLDFVLEYRAAVDRLTGDQANNLRAVELVEEGEWEIARQLRDVLRVISVKQP